mmetsp:Transcript_15015/g.24837  ORF Transcript_15015/g.24837 Transcript_15015/m.24837 type:complete len:310 (-) Transcript_15015:872-1801(-)
MMRILLIALAACSASAFVPASRGFGSTKVFSSAALSGDDFEGIDMERILGTKKFKKQIKKFQRIAKNKVKAADQEAVKASNRETHLAASAGSNDEAAATGLKLLICGAPAAGKGTQCAFIKEKFGVVHLSTGDMLRAAVAAETEVGKQAKDFMESGKLVPDEVIIGIVKDRLDEDDCKSKGWLLDGFPRTEAQAQALADAGITGDCFIMLNVPDSDLVERVVGRRTDPVTGEIYHMTFSPPSDPEVLARLEQRSDDTEEKVKVRLEQYHANVDAVKGSYTDISVEIVGTGKPDEVFKAIDAAVSAKVSA